jgi:Zn-dependent protease/predicted transcriptional regulator
MLARSRKHGTDMTDLKFAGGKRSGLRLFSLFGIEIRLDWSVLIIFTLIVYSLGAGLFPQWHPDWSPATAWTTALAAGVIFFASLLAHEMAHSLMARRFGIAVPRITLFLFGGMAEIEQDARSPKEEFSIAIVGPLMSAALGLLFIMIASVAMGEASLAALAEDPEAVMATLTPAVTACLWLGSVNLILAIFNMVPGFPLDGGRVFRAGVWWATGDAVRATRLASNAGRLVGWGIIALGFWNIFALQNLGGLWLVLIGWFLTHLARASYRQMVTERSLSSALVRDVMRTRFDTVPVSASIEDFVENYLLRSSQQLWPVTEHDRVVGAVSYTDIATLPAAERAGRSVRDVAKPIDDRPSLSADALASTALRQLSAIGDEPVVVLSGGRVVGLLRASDVLRWTLMHPPA